MVTLFDSNDLISFAKFCISKKRTSDLTKKYGVEKAFQRRLEIDGEDINAWIVAMSEAEELIAEPIIETENIDESTNS